MENKIQYLPPLDDIHTVYYIVDLGANPLQELPSSLDLGAYIVYLNVENCELLSLPFWVSTNVELPFGGGNPYYQSMSQNASTAAAVGCLVEDPRGGGRIPIDVIDSKMKR